MRVQEYILVEVMSTPAFVAHDREGIINSVDQESFCAKVGACVGMGAAACTTRLLSSTLLRGLELWGCLLRIKHLLILSRPPLPLPPLSFVGSSKAPDDLAPGTRSLSHELFSVSQRLVDRSRPTPLVLIKMLGQPAVFVCSVVRYRPKERIAGACANRQLPRL